MKQIYGAMAVVLLFPFTVYAVFSVYLVTNNGLAEYVWREMTTEVYKRITR